MDTDFLLQKKCFNGFETIFTYKDNLGTINILSSYNNKLPESKDVVSINLILKFFHNFDYINS